MPEQDNLRGEVPLFSRREFLTRSALAAAAPLILPAFRGRPLELGTEVDVPILPDDLLRHWPALLLQIPPQQSTTEVDFKADFGAVGDGNYNDMPAFQELANAINAERIPPYSVVNIPEGVYRMIGDERVTINKPVILRGEGPSKTTLRPEYTSQNTFFLVVSGARSYVRHSTGIYAGTQDTNRYPNVPFSPIENEPSRGDLSIAASRPGLFSQGDYGYVLCDDYGPEIVHAPNNRRSKHFLLKQHVQIESVDGSDITFDIPLRQNFSGASPRLYRWEPVRGFGLEHMTIDDRSIIAESRALTTFTSVLLDGTTYSWVWDVHFTNNTSIPLHLYRSRKTIVCESLFNDAKYQGEGGNGYLPQLHLCDDCLVEYSTSIGGRHALICNATSWGNVFRYNRVIGTQNIETHGEYNLENLYFRNSAGQSRLEIGGGGSGTHAHDGPYNQFRENFGLVFNILKRADEANSIIDNWSVRGIQDSGVNTLKQGNSQIPKNWRAFPFEQFCGHDHTETAEIARPN